MTRPSHLQLVHASPHAPARGAGPSGRITLPRGPELERFLHAAAERGLDSVQALRLAIERALVLIDADTLGLERSAVRHLLCAAAARAGVHQPLSCERAAYVRRLSTSQPLPARELPDSLTVELPDELVARARGVVPLSALGEEAVGEMIAWELAATLDRRAMGEWALLILAGRRRALTG